MMATSTRPQPALEETANWLAYAECARQVACAKRTGPAGYSPQVREGRVCNRSNPDGLQIRPT